VGGTATLHLTDRVSLKSITAYRSTDSLGVRDADNTAFVILTSDLTTGSKQFSEELQVQLAFDKGNAIFGGYYFDEATDERLTVFLPFPPSPPVIASLLAGGPGTRDLQVSDLQTDSLAAFGQVTVRPLPGLELAGGLRYTEDRKTYQGRSSTCSPRRSPIPTPCPPGPSPRAGHCSSTTARSRTPSRP
jgi:iron complex outermembrane receptor protein